MQRAVLNHVDNIYTDVSRDLVKGVNPAIILFILPPSPSCSSIMVSVKPAAATELGGGGGAGGATG